MVLPIFPEGGLTSSVVTTVWVGVFVLAFFNLRFGWVLSGLVVPGYLVPLLILRPVAAGVIVVEAILTYAIVWAFSERLARGRFPSLFGRDRFMGLVLASIAVRAALDGWLLPLAASWLAVHLDRQIDWHSNLQSFGLIVVSLMANQFWKPGLVRGLLSAFVIIAITWLVVRFGLMEFTNFRLSGVSYVYEGLASSILASPKAYIILVVTAMLASQMNLRYGWDFSGILIPALIALQWYQPTKILSSFVEATIVYLLAQGVLQLPWLKGVTIEGARKLVLFFNVSFAYRLVLGHILAWLAIDVRTTDFYGFGYLLSTLLAIKAYDKAIFARVMRSTLEVSLGGAILGNVIGIVLAWLMPASIAASAATPGAPKLAPGRRETLVTAAVGDAHARANGGEQPLLREGEMDEVEDALRMLASGAAPQFVAPGLRQGAFTLTTDGKGAFALSRLAGAGRDLVLFNPRGRRDLAVVVPDVAHLGLGAAGLSLFESQDARWLVLGAPLTIRARAGDSLLARFRAAVPVTQLIVSGRDAGGPQLSLSGKSATVINLAGLRRALPGLHTSFGIAQVDPGRDEARLLLPLLTTVALAGNAAPGATAVDCAIAETSEQRLVEPEIADLAFVRFEVAEPLIAALGRGENDAPLVRRNAALAGLSLDRCRLADREVWRLATPRGRFGTYLFDPAGNRDRMTQASGDFAELRESGLLIGAASKSGAIFFAPAESGLIESQRSLFGVVSQAWIRAMEDKAGEVIQLRRPASQGLRLAGSPAVLIAPDWIEDDPAHGRLLMDIAHRAGLGAALLDRTVSTSGYEVVPDTSLRYLNLSWNKRFATFWIFPRSVAGAAR